MVVHEPGPWFAQVLDGLAGQDYTNLRFLFLITGETGNLPSIISDRVPSAFVRAVNGNPGFGAAANEVLHLVEGENGFFCFLHDDVALEPGTIRILVEELYRSNAGIVGPKLVDWDHPRRLQHVGLGVDRFGEVDPIVEPGELDQEQHDAVRDIFAVPSACLLARADLFRSIGGFDPAIEYHGDDVDLCWRAHLSGARVVVVPATRVRHREALTDRRPDLHHAALAARGRMRSVTTLTGARRLAWVMPQLVLFTLVEVVASTIVGRFRQAMAALAALGGLVARAPATITRRRQVAHLRQVPDTEVAGLQVSGSARLTSFLRSRDAQAADPDSVHERRWRETAGSAPALAWLTVVVLFLIASRELITSGVPRFGEFLLIPDSPSDMLKAYASGWSGHGLGSNAPVPTGLALIALGSVGALFHTGLLHTVAVLGLVLVGMLAVWRLGAVFPSPRARIVAMAVYGLLPLPSQLLSAGRWSGLVVYAALPLAVHLLRRLAGLDSSLADDARPDADGVHTVSRQRVVRLGAQLSLLCATAIAFAPSFGFVMVVAGVTLGLATLLVGTRWRSAAAIAGMSILAVAVGLLANLPWSASLAGSDGWTSIVGVPVATSRSLGLTTLAEFGIGRSRFAMLALGFYLPIFAAPLVARSWRFAWAVRAASLVAVFGAIAVLDDRAALPVRMPEPGILLVPVGLGIALAAGCLAAAFETDVLKGSFGWRQPLGVLSAVALAVAIVPGVAVLGNGRWRMPERTLQSVYAEFPTDPAEGDYRILWVGDPRAIPVAAWTYQSGVGYAITDDGPLSITDYWAGRPTAAEDEVAHALRQMAAGVTLRGGRLLAQYGIRFVVVPLADGFNGTIANPLPAPEGLVDVLEDQLDLAAPLTSPPNYLVYENTAYTPTRAMLSSEGADASTFAGDEAGAQADLRGSVPFAVGAPDEGPAGGDLSEGTLHVAVPFDSGWTLRVDGISIDGRRAFGSTLAFDVAEGGRAALEYDPPLSRSMWVIAQLLMWLTMLIVASRLRPSALLRRRRQISALDDTTPVADLSAPIDSPSPDIHLSLVELPVEPLEEMP